MIIWLRLFLPSPSRTGWGRQSEVNAQLLLSSSDPRAGRTHGSHRNRSLPPDGKVKSKASVSPPPRILHKLSHQTSNHMPPKTLFLPGEQLRVTWSPWGSSLLIVKKQCTTHQHAVASCMFSLGFIFMLNDSQELSVIFVPLVRPDQTPMVEVFYF